MITQTKTKEAYLTQAQFDAKQQAGTLTPYEPYNIEGEPIASTTDLGMVKVDGTSITINNGVISADIDISGKQDWVDRVSSISGASTNTQYPSAKCVYDRLAGLQFWKGTQAEYDALGTYDNETMYVIVG